MKLNIQMFGGRGASSSSSKSTINGKEIVKSVPQGFRYWNIGRNAPSGYIGLIKNPGATNSETVYLKTQYADEIAKLGYAGKIAMNYDTMAILNRQITARENRLERTVGLLRNTREKELNDMKKAREIRKKLGL